MSDAKSVTTDVRNSAYNPVWGNFVDRSRFPFVTRRVVACLMLHEFSLARKEIKISNARETYAVLLSSSRILS